MPEIYKPRLLKPVLAIKLKEEVIAPAGDWLTIDPNDDTVCHYTEAQFFSFYPRREKERKSIRKNSRSSQPRKATPPMTAREDTILMMQTGRFFDILARSPEPMTLAAVKARAAEIGIDKTSSVSAALSTMKKHGLVSLTVPPGTDRNGVWAPTDRGLVIFQRLDNVCYTRYGLTPPSSPE